MEMEGHLGDNTDVPLNLEQQVQPRQKCNQVFRICTLKFHDTLQYAAYLLIENFSVAPGRPELMFSAKMSISLLTSVQISCSLQPARFDGQ